MSRPTTKQELLTAAESEYEKLVSVISAMTEKELSTLFDFSADTKKKEAHWTRDKNLRDVLIHLYEWHKLLLDFVQWNINGKIKPFLPFPYTWRTYGNMNIEFWKKHQNTSLDDAKILLEKSHSEVMRLADTLSDEELFGKKVYGWVGSGTLGSFFIANTSSHYTWAIKKLKAHKRNCDKAAKCMDAKCIL